MGNEKKNGGKEGGYVITQLFFVMYIFCIAAFFFTVYLYSTIFEAPSKIINIFKSKNKNKDEQGSNL